MLVLTRKSDERILIGDSVELIVLSVQGNRIRLGIQAPAEVAIARMPRSPDLTSGLMLVEAENQELCPCL